MPDSAKEISGNKYVKTGMGETMEASKVIHLVINVCTTLWTLQSKGSITNHIPLSCSKKSLLLRRGIALDHWSHVLSIMLENVFDYCFVTMLRLILLMEADFNFVKKNLPRKNVG